MKTLNFRQKELGLEFKLTQVRLRKMVNFIRCNAIVPLIGTSNGYYVSYNKEEVAKQIQSLNERASSIMNAANGLNKFV